MPRKSSWIAWGSVGVALAGYLGLGSSPDTWTFQHWMQAIVVIGGIVDAKLDLRAGKADQ